MIRTIKIIFLSMNVKTLSKKSALITLALVLLLVVLSVAFLWKDTFYFENTGALNHSLELSYFSNATLFDGTLHINPELKDVPVTPSVVLWAYPPGIYTLMNLTYDVFGYRTTNVNIIFLILQIVAVVLAFFTFRKILNKFASFVMALLVLAFIANISILPDFVLLPFLILVFTIIFHYYPPSVSKPKVLTLIFLGLLAGIITFIKHNTGLLLFVSLSSYIFFSALEFEAKDGHKPRSGKILVAVILAVHLIFALVFLLQMSSAITSIFYLLPLVIFIVVFIYYCLFKNRDVTIRGKEFFRNFGTFAAPFVVIMAAWLIWFGSAVGFSRYIQSLYSMYSGFTGIWDVGIPAVFTRTFNNQGLGSISAIGDTVYSLFSACLVFIPFIAAMIAAICISRHLLKNDVARIKKYLGICVLGVMGIFFLYPLESGHNIASRVFLFVFILLFFLAQTKFFTRRNAIIVFTVLLVFVAPLLINHVGAGLKAGGEDYVAVSDTVNTQMPGELAREIDRAAGLINTATQENKYYIIDSYSVLNMFYMLTDVTPKNYFVEMRPGIMNKQVTAEIIDVVKDYQYLVVNKKQYDDFLKGNSYNPDLDNLLNYVKNNYAVKDTFIKNLEKDDAGLADFYIMAKPAP